MARLPRLYAPQVPQLVQAEFAYPLARPTDPTPVAELDRLLEWLQRDARENQAALHGWTLLPDRISLLATPADPSSISRLIQALGRRIATGMRHGRVFTGRYRSALVEPDRWVLPALIWLESLPVQAQHVDKAESWPWSSAPTHTGIHPRRDAIATDHADYWHLGNTPFARQARYRERLAAGLSQAHSQRIQQALFGQWALGEPEFLAHIAPRATRRLAPAPKGRPKKQVTEDVAEE